MSEEWVTATLGEAADVLMGQSPPGESYNTSGIGLPFIQGSAEFGVDTPTPVKWCSQPAKVAEIGDLMVSVRAPVGDSNFADQRTAIGRGLAIVRGKPDALTGYLRLVVQNETANLVSASGSGMFSSITAANLRGFKVLLPPLPVQRRIVDLMSHLDAHIANLHAERAAVDRLMVSTAEGWGHCSPDTSVPLGSVALMYQPKTLAKADLTALGAHPVFGANGLIGYHDEFNHSESQVAVTCRGATCGRVNWTPPLCWITGNAMVVSPLDESTLDQRYLFWALQFMTNISSSISGSAQPQITRTSLSPVCIPLPELSEQKALAQTLDSIAGQVDALGLEIDQANDLRSTLLSVLLSGTLSLPTEYDTILEQVA